MTIWRKNINILSLNKPLLRGGYTIVEVLIVLGVTTVLFVAIVGTFSGQQGRTEFTQGVRDMESRVRDILNDVSTGYYPANSSYSCKRDLSLDEGPDFVNTPSGQGTNSECIFIGRVIQFKVTSTNDEEYNVISVAGVRLKADGSEVRTIQEAIPRALVPTGDAYDPPNLTENSKYPGGMKIGKVTYQDGGLPTEVSSVGVFTTFGTTGSNGVKSGSLNVNIIALGSSSPETLTIFSDTVINNLFSSSPVTNPSNGMTVCFISTSSKQIALMTIGGNERQLTVDTVIRDGTTTCP